MQDRKLIALPPIISAVICLAAVLLGSVALAGLFMVAHASGSLSAMKAAVFVAAMAYAAQVAAAILEIYVAAKIETWKANAPSAYDGLPLASEDNTTARLRIASTLLWILAMLAFLVTLAVI